MQLFVDILFNIFYNSIEKANVETKSGGNRTKLVNKMSASSLETNTKPSRISYTSLLPVSNFVDVFVNQIIIVFKENKIAYLDEI